MRSNTRIQAQTICAHLLCKIFRCSDQSMECLKIAITKNWTTRRIKQAGMKMLQIMPEQCHRSDNASLRIAAENAVPPPITFHASPKRGLHKMAVFMSTHKFIQLFRMRKINKLNHRILLSSYFDTLRIHDGCIISSSDLHQSCIIPPTLSFLLSLQARQRQRDSPLRRWISRRIAKRQNRFGNTAQKRNGCRFRHTGSTMRDKHSALP